MKNAFGLSSIIVFGTSTVWTSNVVPAKIGDSRGGSPDILAKSLANPDKIFKNNEKKKKLKIFSGFASDLAIKSGDPQETLRGGSPNNFCQDNIDGLHCIMAIQVEKFSRNGYKIRKVFGLELPVVKWNYQILIIGGMLSCQKLDITLQN